MSEEITALLREIRDQQRIQLDRQAEALALQHRQFERYEAQLAGSSTSTIAPRPSSGAQARP
jgi:hypothetical protein